MKQTLEFNLVMVKDEKIGGFTAFFKQFPNVIVEGDDQNSTVEKLIQCLKDVLHYDSDSQPINSNKVIERTVQFEAIA